MAEIYLPGGLPPQVLNRLQKRKLTYSATPVKLTNIAECIITPAFFLQSKRLYLILVTDELLAQEIQPSPGWYDVPEQGYVTWITGFKQVAQSGWSSKWNRALIYEAIEGEPPPDATMPEKGQVIH